MALITVEKTVKVIGRRVVVVWSAVTTVGTSETQTVCSFPVDVSPLLPSGHPYTSFKLLRGFISSASEAAPVAASTGISLYFSTGNSVYYGPMCVMGMSRQFDLTKWMHRGQTRIHTTGAIVLGCKFHGSGGDGGEGITVIAELEVY